MGYSEGPSDWPFVIGYIALALQGFVGYGIMGGTLAKTRTVAPIEIENVHRTKNYVSYNVKGTNKVVTSTEARFVNNEFEVIETRSYNIYGIELLKTYSTELK
jgi:hypothetical protein